MLRDYLKVEKEDRLVEQQSRHDNSQHYSSRRSWSDSFRITQFDNAGKVVVDKLTDAL